MQIKTIVYHATRKPFEGSFDEGKIGTGNDVGYSGRGFYFFPSMEDAKFAAPGGYVKPFEINLKKAYHLTGRDDPFSAEYPSLTDEEVRDNITELLLGQGFDGSVRYLNGKIEEVCVFSYRKKGFDGNKKIRQTEKGWSKV